MDPVCRGVLIMMRQLKDGGEAGREEKAPVVPAERIVSAPAVMRG